MTAPVRIGVLRDVPTPPEHDLGMNAMRLALDAANASGGLHGRPIELVVAEAQRSAAGSHANVAATQAAWEALADDPRVLAMIGPSTTPCILALHPSIEAREMPAIHWAGTDRACGPWTFQFQAGSLSEEGPALAYLAAHKGLRKVACFRGSGDYGAAYLGPFRRAAEALGIAIAAELSLAPDGSDIDAAVAAARASGADAVVAMGLFFLGVPLARAITAQDWQVPCFGNCGFALAAARDAEARAALSGWIATDMVDPCNSVATDMFDRYAAHHGTRPAGASACFGYDLMQLMLAGVAHAPALTRAGIRAGLEAVRGLPCATGGAGSWMGFGPDERKALKGPRLFLFSAIAADGLHPVPA
ncbi:ABC transporter substrate-binding protein [Novosphingobium malaysiense]|uniref:Leucine-binding protein domain-containing protein n=1 Tax=Novosphingobium malaysiense TaxID=1348853 RepID=A0A0B1ZH45_9SPHN|nr:ABC transporter substrate-binding protein [Novosphingobium malaysiense]KHK89837.1 hypothetical protein LK12_18140 [Novosphingobium malaysiense]